MSSGLSQRVLARRLQRVHSYIAKLEVGERRLDVEEFVAYARALGTDPVSFLAAFVSTGL